MSIALQHRDLMKRDFLELSEMQQALFLCSACERQFPVYAYFSKDQNWGNATKLRHALDQCWEWSTSFGTAVKPTELFARDFLEVTGGQSVSGHANPPYYSIADLVSYISNDFQDKSVSPITNAINIIDAFLYDAVFTKVSKENDSAIDSSPLMTQEIHRQNQDMWRVSQADWQTLDWANIKKSNTGLSVLNP